MHPDRTESFFLFKKFGLISVILNKIKIKKKISS